MEPDQPVRVHENGNLTCGTIVLKPYRKRQLYREQHDLMAKYLQDKGRPLDVSDIRQQSIHDVIDRMQAEGRASITLDELIDVFSHQHRISLIKDFMLRRLEDYAQRRWWQERNEALQLGDNDKVRSMEEEFNAKKQLANRLANLPQ